MSNIFERAANLLMTGGHCKGQLSQGSAHCAIGALVHSRPVDLTKRVLGSSIWTDVYTPKPHPEYDAADLAAKALHRKGLAVPVEYDDELGLSKHPLAAWNDDPATSSEDVILLFKELGSEQ